MHYGISIQSLPRAQDVDAVTSPRWRQGKLRLDNVEPRLIKTHNQTGYITTYADPFVKAFIQRAACAQGPVLELAAGYGLPSIAAVDAGCRDVTISDIDASHLEYAQSLPQFGKAIKTVEGGLPNKVNFEDAHYEVILMSRVLHFFDGPSVAETLENIWRWLRPNGEAYIICDSVHQGQFGAFRGEYEKRVRAGARWPGYFDGMNALHGARASDLPDCFHYFDARSLSAALTVAKFDIEVMSVFSRPEYPLEKKLDGREAIGAIVRKSHAWTAEG